MKKVKERKAIYFRKAVRNSVACLAAASLVLGAVPVSADGPVPAPAPTPVPAPTGGATPVPADGTTPAPTAESVSYDYVITDYGANGTDQASDQAAIQEALDQVKGAAKQMTVYFPAGDYYIDQKALQVYSNTHIILDQKATVHRMDSMLDKMLLHNVDQNGKMDAIGGYDMSHDITLEGGTWDGGNIAKAKDAADLIRFDHAQNIVMKDCTLKNVYDNHMIEYVAIKDGSISGCTISGFRYLKGKEKDNYYAREAIQLETAWTNKPNNKNDVDALWAPGSVVDGTSCQQVTVSNNTFIDMPCGVGQHHYSEDGKYRNQGITISNNTFSCANSMKACKTAVTCSGMNDITITGNKITGPYYFGVYIAASSNVTFSDNNISNVADNGIMMNSGSVKAITGNTISNSTGHSISIASGTLTTLSKNTINNPKQNGISITKGNINSISDNTINNVKNNGISVTDEATIDQMTGNILNKIGHDGIVQGKGKIKLIKNNEINSAKLHGISLLGGTAGAGQNTSKGIIENVITDCGGIAISVSKKGKASAISGNTINNPVQSGISISSGKISSISNNKISNTKKHGIVVNGKVTITQMTGNTLSKIGYDGIVLGKGKINLLKDNKINTVKLHGISITGGTVGVGKKRSKGIIKNTITNCKKGNGISVSKKGVVSAIDKNKITSVKNNGISIVNSSVVYWVTNNTIKKCKKHGIWNGSSRKKAKLKGNKGKTK